MNPHHNPRLIKSVQEFRTFRRGIKERVVFVPTMGALHSGHGKLIDEALSLGKEVVVSIFVNPTQFAPGEDFERYPRTLDRDLKLVGKRGTVTVFCPSVEEIYQQEASVYVSEDRVSQLLCGKFRPGHFRGVLTVVNLLFQIVRPSVALFGLKDAQQFFLIQKMVRDLHMDVEILGVPTVREGDGLAMSSRNTYLNPRERELAPRIYQGLLKAHNFFEGSKDMTHWQHIKSEILAPWKEFGFEPQYLEALSVPKFDHSLDPASAVLIAVAGYLGKTRLIDNIICFPEKLRAHGVNVLGLSKE